MTRIPLAILLALTLPLSSSRADDEAQRPSRPLTQADAGAGRTPYLRECSRCHGKRGDGTGPQAAAVDPRPRDFTKRLFKFRTTPSGQPPTTADVLRTIERGLPGTAMPSFARLPEKERKLFAARVLGFAKLLDEREPVAVAAPGPPPPTTAASIARGKQFYVDAGCIECHGPEGRGDGKSVATWEDNDGRPTRPRDFTEGVFRGGGEQVDLYYRIVTGLNGTPMPSYGDALAPADLWAVVDYVRSLAAAR
jgi:mono/diheme cytochrome c family protein